MEGNKICFCTNVRKVTTAKWISTNASRTRARTALRAKTATTGIAAAVCPATRAPFVKWTSPSVDTTTPTSTLSPLLPTSHPPAATAPDASKGPDWSFTVSVLKVYY